MSANLNDAIVLVAMAFNGVHDKAGQPYILHLMKVMHYCKTDDQEINQIAILHDYIEDIHEGDVETGIKVLETHGYTDRVIAGVVALTKVKGETYDQYKSKVKANADAVKVKMADLRHNSDIRRLKGVTEKDIARTVKYMQFYQELKDL